MKKRPVCRNLQPQIIETGASDVWQRAIFFQGLTDCGNRKEHDRAEIKIITDAAPLIIVDRMFLSPHITIPRSLLIIIRINHPRLRRFRHFDKAFQRIRTQLNFLRLPDDQQIGRFYFFQESQECFPRDERGCP